MKLVGRFKIIEKHRSHADVIKNSIIGDVLEISTDLSRELKPNNKLNANTPQITVTNLETGESSTKYFRSWVSILNKLKLEEVR